LTTTSRQGSLKAPLQRMLKQMGLYERLKVSWVYSVYWSIFNPTLVKDRASEIEFYRHVLQGFRKGGLIFDIGANHGQKTFAFLALGAHVVAIEPDDANQKRLKDRFLRYRMSPKPVQLVAKAVSERASVATMWVDTPGSAKNTMSPKWVATLREDPKRFGERFEFSGSREVETTTVDDLMATYGVPFFIKIDVEGHEISVLRGMTRPVPYLSFEVNLPEFATEGLECIRLLNNIQENGEFNYTGDSAFSFLLAEWVPYQQFVRVFGEMQNRSVDVYWRTLTPSHLGDVR